MTVAPFTLRHPSGLTIQPGITESDVTRHVAAQPRDMRNGYVWHDLPQATIEGDAVSLSLCFFEGKLSLIQLAVVDARYGTSWSEWSAEKDRERAEATGSWLARIGYPVGTYSWGEVWAGTDARSGDGGGLIRFSQAPPR